MDCGVKYPYFVMEFDHSESGSKIGTINKLANDYIG